MKNIKIGLYLLISVSFIYVIFNLNISLYNLSIVLNNFFVSLFPYLFTFLIINQLLIKTNLISIFGYILQFILYPLFKINAKTSSLLLISILNGFPSSVLYSHIMIKEKYLDSSNTTPIALYFFLPSYSFLFFLVKNNLEPNYFYLLILSIYLPCFIFLLLNRNKSKDKYIKLNDIKSDLKLSFNKFNYINDLKEIFKNSFLTLINILGMITFYSIITLMIKNDFIKGLFEFSIPTISILNSDYNNIFKALAITIILVFSSFSSLSQASIYLEDINISFITFIKKRIEILTLSLIIFTLSLYVYLL